MSRRPQLSKEDIRLRRTMMKEQLKNVKRVVEHNKLEQTKAIIGGNGCVTTADQAIKLGLIKRKTNGN